jgi:hypothetical protein
VIRGAYGIYYGGLENIAATVLPPQNYPYNPSDSWSRPSTCVAGNCATDGVHLATGFTPLITGYQATVSLPGAVGWLPDLKTEYTESYNLTWEQTVLKNTIATIGYVGNESRHLEVFTNANGSAALLPPGSVAANSDPFPLLGGASVVYPVGYTDYNSLQAGLQRRLENGLQFMANYTWAHALGDSYSEL